MADNYYRSQYARELEQFAELLVAYSVIQDPSPLYTAAGECRKSGIDGCWSYHLERLLIHNVVDTKKFPTDVSNISLELSISAVGYCEPEEGCDPFAELVLEIFIKGELANFEAEGHQLVYCSWYMDKHIIKEGDGITKFTHPIYHFQFGGKTLKYLTQTNDNPSLFGASLFLDSPRLAHPPLEAILGIDFVLTNFISSDKLTFRDEGTYSNLIQSKQEKLWKPYIQSLYQAWNNVKDDYPWQPMLIWPQLFPKRF